MQFKYKSNICPLCHGNSTYSNLYQLIFNTFINFNQQLIDCPFTILVCQRLCQIQSIKYCQMIQQPANLKNKKSIDFRVSDLNLHKHKSIKVFFTDEYLPKVINVQKLGIMELSRGLTYEKVRGCIEFIENDGECLKEEERVEQLREELREKFSKMSLSKFNIGVNQQAKIRYLMKQQQLETLQLNFILGHKYFILDQGIKHIEKGDLLLVYFKDNFREIQKKYEILRNYLYGERLLFPMDQYLQKYKLTRVLSTQKQTTPLYFFVQRFEKEIVKIAEMVQFTIVSITPCLKLMKKQDRKNKGQDLWPPQYSIDLVVNGPRQKIFQLYFFIENLINHVPMNVVEISQSLSVLRDEQEELLKKPDICKLNENQYLIFGDEIDPKETKRILENKEWVRNLDEQELKILKPEIDNKNLDRHISSKIQFERLDLVDDSLVIVCNKRNWQQFDREIDNYLELFQLSASECFGFNDELIRNLFFKYYAQQIQAKYFVKFQSQETKLIRITHQKSIEQVDQLISNSLEQIMRKMIRIQSSAPVDPQSVQNYEQSVLYRERKSSDTSVSQSHIGCRVYKMKQVKIRVKPFDSIKSQKKNIIFILDNYLSDDSLLHDLCRTISIDYYSFLDRATTKKKPDRLRKYLTPLSKYSQSSIFFYMGERDKTQTYDRDLSNLLQDQDDKITMALMLHDKYFLSNCLPLLFQKLKQAEKPIELELLYEGAGDFWLNIEKAMKESNTGIQPICISLLEEDITQILINNIIYANVVQQSIKIDPLQFFIMFHQLKHSERAIISSAQQGYDTQFLINLKEQKVFQIRRSKQYEFPEIKQVEKRYFEGTTIQQYVRILGLYLKKLNFILFYTKKDEEKECLKISDQFYMAYNGQLQSIAFNLQEKKITFQGKDKYPIRINPVNKENLIYEIETHQKELPHVKKCIK